MALSPEQLAKIIQHNSSTLCTPQGQKKLHEMAGAMNVDDNGMVSDEWDNFSLSDPMDSTPKRQANLNQPISQNAVNNSRLPEAVKQSMLEHQIDTSALGGGGDTSFLDNIGRSKPQRKQQVNEQVTYQQPQYQPQQMGIDYSLLKMIVKECLNEYFSNQPLNEGTTLKQIGLAEGKIKLVDNKGNVYGADLEFKGNVNERKKK